jgi:hypothetical protein
MNLTHTSVGPRALDRYATHLPSGEITGLNSCAGVETRRTTRSNTGVAASACCREANQPTVVPTTPNASAALTNAHIGARLPFGVSTGIDRSATPEGARASSIWARASAMSRNRRRTSFSKHRSIKRRMPGGVTAGSRTRSGSRSRIAAMMSDVVPP